MKCDMRRAVSVWGIPIALIVVALVSLFFFVLPFYGVPIHDLNLWLLQKDFSTHVHHPDRSIFIEKKTYLGGPSEHGSHTCVYAVGEIRSAPLTREAVEQAYREAAPSSRVLFTDDESLEQPLDTWRDELVSVAEAASTTDTLYVTYLMKSYPFLGDLRCDD